MPLPVNATFGYCSCDFVWHMEVLLLPIFGPQVKTKKVARFHFENNVPSEHPANFHAHNTEIVLSGTNVIVVIRFPNSSDWSVTFDKSQLII